MSSQVYDESNFTIITEDSLRVKQPKGVSAPMFPHQLAMVKKCHELEIGTTLVEEKTPLKFLHHTHFGPRPAEGALEQIKSEFEIWMSTVEESYMKNLSSEEIVEILFDNRPNLKQTDMNHGVHQTATHLGSVEGMLNWLRRKNA